jgi:muramoyltetrapeptide carboxypeptidase
MNSNGNPQSHLILAVFCLYSFQIGLCFRTNDRQSQVNVLKPPRLKKHDVIGIVAPASAPSSTERIHKGIRYLEQLGYRVELGAHAKAVHGYLAGRDKDRAGDLNAMFADRRVKAIFAVRGGYGTPRLLEHIDYHTIKQHPKILVGYSDLTALQLAIFAKTRLVTISGPMLAVEMAEKMDAFTEEFFWRLLTSPHPIGRVSNPDDAPLKLLFSPLRNRQVEGRLLGGNLSMIISVVGTRFQPSFRDQLLFLEELGEEPYRIDRMLTQLKLAGILRQVKALLLGSFIDCVPTDKTKPTLSVDDVLTEVSDGLKIPVLSGLVYGHLPRKLTMPIGVRARVDLRSRMLEFLEGAVR